VGNVERAGAYGQLDGIGPGAAKRIDASGQQPQLAPGPDDRESAPPTLPRSRLPVAEERLVMTKEAVKELCGASAENGEPCVKRKDHSTVGRSGWTYGWVCSSERFWCSKHDITRLYAGRPCIDCLTDRLDRLEGLSEPPAKAEDAAQVSEPVARAGFVRLTADNGCTYWIRADHITKIATSVDGGTYIETAVSSERLIEPAPVVLERIGKAKGADPLFTSLLLDSLRKVGTP
jgi:hypothetical protein